MLYLSPHPFPPPSHELAVHQAEVHQDEGFWSIPGPIKATLVSPEQPYRCHSEGLYMTEAKESAGQARLKETTELASVKHTFEFGQYFVSDI